MFCFEISFDLQKSCKDRTEFPFATYPVFFNVNILENLATLVRTNKLTLVQYYSLKYRLHSDFSSISTNVFSFLRLQSRIPCIMLLVIMFPSSSLIFDSSLVFPGLLKSTGQVHLCCLMLFSWLDQDCPFFLQEYHRSNSIRHFSLHHFRGIRWYSPQHCDLLLVMLSFVTWLKVIPD